MTSNDQVHTTNRLRLRLFVATDVTNLHSLESIPEVVRYQLYEPMTLHEAEAYIQRDLVSQNTQPRIILELAVELKDSCEFIGRVGLSIDYERRHGDLWFSFLPRVHGQGYAIESAEGLLSLMPTLETIGIECDPRNEPSRKLARRMGFEQTRFQERAFQSKGEWVGSVEYLKKLKPSSVA